MLVQRLLDERLWVYFLAFFVSLFLINIISNFQKKTGKNILFSWFWVALPFFCVSAFRFCVGTDYYTYHLYQIPLLSSDKLTLLEYLRYDLLFVFVVKICRYFSDDTFWIFTVLSVCPFFYSKWIIKESPRPTYSLTLYFLLCIFSTSLNIMRQSFAAGLFWLGLSLWIKNEKKRAVLFFLLMIFMHRTAIIFFPLLLILDRDIKKKTKCIVCFSLFIFSSSFRVVVSSLGILNQIGLGRYFNSVLDTGDYNWRYFLPVLVLFSLDCWYRVSEVSPEYKAYSNCLFFTFALICFSSALPLSNRMIYMMLPVLVIYIPLLTKLVPRYRIVILAFFLLYSSAIFYKQIVIDNAHQTLPYRTIWQKNEARFSDVDLKRLLRQ